MSTSTNTENYQERNLLRFCEVMKNIPRRVQKCEIYGTVTVVVDSSHAKNIFRKIAPCASTAVIYDALCILQERLDHVFNN